MTRSPVTSGLLGALWAAGSAAAADPSTFARMIIDGQYDDWSSVPVAFADPVGDAGGGTADLAHAWIANDPDFLYLRFEIGSPANLPTIPTPLRIYFDLDQSADTGWAVGNIGSDFVLLFPERHGAEQTATKFQAATLTHAALDLVTGPTFADTQFELRIRRDAALPIRGRPLLAGAGFDLIMEARTAAGATADWAPDDAAAHSYAMAKGCLRPYASIPLERTHPRHVRLMSYNMLWDGLFKRPEPHRRILQAVQPDLICYQEVNSPAAAIQARLDADLPLSKGMTWQVHKASSNVIASRWPLSMQRRDTVPGTGRGQAMALVDLPDRYYQEDFYLISAHFKCCGRLGGPEDRRRQRQADACVNWFRDLGEPGGYADLPPGTPFLICGDFNLVGAEQPLRTLITGHVLEQDRYGPDSAPDWDGTELGEVKPLHNAAPAAHTWRDEQSSFGPGRLDFVIYTDSVLAVAKGYVLNTRDMSDESLALYGLHQEDSAEASDHMPLVVDFDFCGAPTPGDLSRDGRVDLEDLTVLGRCFELTAPIPDTCSPRELLCSDLDGDGAVDLNDLATLAVQFGLQERG